MFKDHSPFMLDKFNGLYQRGDDFSCPRDHFPDCNNIQFIGGGAFSTRFGIGISQTVNVPLSNIKRIYNYPTNTANTLIVLVQDGSNGKIYHVVNESLMYGPILTVAGMTDFAFVPYAGRGYISPFGAFTDGDLIIDKGLQNEFLYVYLGDGTAARKAAGAAPTGALTIANGAAGNTDPGQKIFGVVFEYDTGFLSAPGVLRTFTTAAAFSVSFGTVPVGGAHVVKRHIVSSITIPSFNGDLQGYQLFFIPNGTINDNTTIFLNNVSFFDADLISDASYLLDNYTEIPAGASLTLYHNRLCLSATYTDISLMLLSAVGEPEAINTISGLIVVPLDGNPITNAQELRDVLYVMKRSRTVSYTDNGDVPSSWPLVVVDNALGTSVHGIATVLDSGSSSVDYLIICTYQGISVFNGKYIAPELSFNVDALWRTYNRNQFNRIQIINAPIQKCIYTILPDSTLLVGDYGNGMTPTNMRWTPWSFAMGVNTIAIANIDDLIFGADI